MKLLQQPSKIVSPKGNIVILSWVCRAPVFQGETNASDLLPVRTALTPPIPVSVKTLGRAHAPGAEPRDRLSRPLPSVPYLPASPGHLILSLAFNATDGDRSDVCPFTRDLAPARQTLTAARPRE